MPKVSVCIPAFNSPELFKKCLNSVIMQDLDGFEVIVSDDSSDDAIGNYIKELNLPHIHYFKNQHALGSPGNWNEAVNKARGKYIKILHHDDYFTGKDGLRKFISALESDPEAGMAFCYTKIHFKNDDSVYFHKQTSGQLARLKRETEFIFFRNIIGAPSAVCYKNDKSVLFDKDYKWLVDVDFYFRYLKKYPKFISIAEPLVTVVAGEAGQISGEVTKNGALIISENLNLFLEIYSEKLNQKKSLLFFQELFTNYGYSSFDELQKAIKIPVKLLDFAHEVFEDLPKSALLKKIKKRLLTSRYNKKIFKIERF